MTPFCCFSASTPPTLKSTLSEKDSSFTKEASPSTVSEPAPMIPNLQLGSTISSWPWINLTIFIPSSPIAVCCDSTPANILFLWFRKSSTPIMCWEPPELPILTWLCSIKREILQRLSCVSIMRTCGYRWTKATPPTLSWQRIFKLSSNLPFITLRLRLTRAYPSTSLRFRLAYLIPMIRTWSPLISATRPSTLQSWRKPSATIWLTSAALYSAPCSYMTPLPQMPAKWKSSSKKCSHRPKSSAK